MGTKSSTTSSVAGAIEQGYLTLDYSPLDESKTNYQDCNSHARSKGARDVTLF